MNMISEDLIELARRVLDANRAAGKRIAVANSCTGGLVSAALTELPGASDVSEAGFVNSSDLSNEDVLTVTPAVLTTSARVSIAVAWSLATRAPPGATRAMGDGGRRGGSGVHGENEVI